MGVRNAIAFSSNAQCVASDITEGAASRSRRELNSDDAQTRNVRGLDDSFYSLYKAVRETGNGRPLNSHEEFRHSKRAKGHRHNSVCSRTQQRVPKFALPKNGTLEKKFLRVLYHNSSKRLSFCSIKL
jgi:hypothetical protein